ncbi:MAG TPA: PA14 domain-containing protein, partial [Dehalococcoidia bacterium]|nr:PA14 domain-containing protein [Dehalococcoidia bacterium]
GNFGAFVWIAALIVAVGTLILASRPRPKDLTPPALAPDVPVLRRGEGIGGEVLGARSFPASFATWALPLAVFVVALALRLYQLDQVPFGIWYDEAETALEARRLMTGAAYEPLSRNFGRDPSLFFYLVGISLTVFGDSLLSVRLVTALLGALGAVATALAGREMFGWRVGLVAGLFLAFSRWQLDFSRFGMINVTAPLVAAAGFWLLARAIRRESWVDLGWCGLVMGLGFHSYAGFRVIFGALLVAFAIGALIRRWRPRVALGRAALWLALAALAGLPVLLFAARFPDEYNKRLNETFLLARTNTTQEKIDALVNNTKVHLLMFNYRGDRNGRHNVPGLPMIDALQGVLFVLGLAHGLARAARIDWRYLILIGWGIAALSGGILSLDFEAPQGARTIAITAVIAIVAALGLVLALDRLSLLIGLLQRRVAGRRRLVWRLGPPVAALIAAAVLVSVGWTTAETYFDRQMPERSSWLEFSPRETILAREAQRLSAEYPLVLSTQTLISHPAIKFVATGLRGLQPFDPVGDLPLRRAVNALIFLDDRDRALWDEVARYYPDAKSTLFFPPREAGPILIEFPITREQVEARRGLEASYRSTTGATVSRQDKLVDFDWRSTSPPVPVPFEVVWTGGLAVPQTGEYTFAIPSDVTLSVDGHDFAASEFPEGVRLWLARGNHLIRLAGAVSAPRDMRLRWRIPGAHEFSVVPAEFLYAGVPGGTGLLGRFYQGNNWQGAPVQERIDPVLAMYFHLLPMQRPYSIEWSGTLEVPAGGTYRIGVEQVSTATVWIDERLVLTNEARNQYLEAPVDLTPGRHAIRVRFRDQDGGSHVYLFWTPPGQPRQHIPGQYLYPPPPEPIR